MGEKGDKTSSISVTAANEFVLKLNTLGNITSKNMFGGHGIFYDAKMFGMVNSKGMCYLKSDELLKSEMSVLGSIPHTRMPYTSVSDQIYSNENQLLYFARKSIELALK